MNIDFAIVLFSLAADPCFARACAGAAH